MFKSCLTIIRPNGRCYYYLYNFCNFYDIFYPFLPTILFIDKEKSLEKNNPNNNDSNSRNGGNRYKKDLSKFKPQVFIIFKLCLNHVWPLFNQIEDAIIINTVFVIFMIFFILFFYLLFFLQIKKKP